MIDDYGGKPKGGPEPEPDPEPEGAPGVGLDRIEKLIRSAAKMSFGVESCDRDRVADALDEIEHRLIQRYGPDVAKRMLAISDKLCEVMSLFLLKSVGIHHPSLFFGALRASVDRMLVLMVPLGDQQACRDTFGLMSGEDIERLLIEELMKDVRTIDKLID